MTKEQLEVENALLLQAIKDVQAIVMSLLIQLETEPEPHTEQGIEY